MEIAPPEWVKNPLVIQRKTLMGPGPSNSSPRILHALSQPILGHMHPEMFKIMDEIKEGIQYIFQTKNALTLALSASGHGGIEAVLCNLLEPGDKILVAVNGEWGDRIADMSTRYGAIPSKIHTELGSNFKLSVLEESIRSIKPKLLFIVQGESSTGIYQPLEGLGDICQRMEISPPEWVKNPLVIQRKTLMGPGPSNSSPRILHALSQPILGHMHPEMFKIMDEIKEGIQYIFQTKNALTLALSASGHGGIEAVLCNLLEPGDKILVAVNGEWGDRIADMSTRYGAIPSKIHTELGSNFKLSFLEESIRSIKPKLLFIVQGESSTGIYQPLEGLGDICQRYGCLLAVDTVASLGCVPFLMDQWKVDAVYTGSQKILGAPPGITPISFSTRAQKVIFERKSLISVYYWDMKILGQQWNCFNNVRPYHHTVCSNLLYALREAIAVIAEEGLEKVIDRHQICAKLLYDGIKRLGLELFVDDFQSRLPSVTTIKVPENVDWKTVVTYAMQKYSFEISGGLGPTAGKVFRIGLMGYNATEENVKMLLMIFEESLKFAKTSTNSKL